LPQSVLSLDINWAPLLSASLEQVVRPPGQWSPPVFLCQFRQRTQYERAQHSATNCISPARSQQHLHLHLHLHLPPAPNQSGRYTAPLPSLPPLYFHSLLHRHTHPPTSTSPRSIDVDFPRYSRLSTPDRPPSSLAAHTRFREQEFSLAAISPLHFAPLFNGRLTANFWLDFRNRE
jgi:hypothetical protein